MPGVAISEDEFAQFCSYTEKQKADCMELYLIEGMNQQEVQEMVFGDVSKFAHRVSLIHRCYNFSGKNSGKYRDGCRFEQKYGYHISREDIVAFIETYPYGTFENGVTFEDFLLAQLETESEELEGNSDFGGNGFQYSQRTGNVYRRDDFDHEYEDDFRCEGEYERGDGSRLSWSIGGFNKKGITFILWLISLIPSVPWLMGFLYDFYRYEFLRNFSDGFIDYLERFESIPLIFVVVWGVPLALFVANGGLKVIYNIFRLVFMIPNKYIKELVLAVVAAFVFMIMFLSGECIIIAFYILVRLIMRDFD